MLVEKSILSCPCRCKEGTGDSFGCCVPCTQLTGSTAQHLGTEARCIADVPWIAQHRAMCPYQHKCVCGASFIVWLSTGKASSDLPATCIVNSASVPSQQAQAVVCIICKNLPHCCDWAQKHKKQNPACILKIFQQEQVSFHGFCLGKVRKL